MFHTKQEPTNREAFTKIIGRALAYLSYLADMLALDADHAQTAHISLHSITTSKSRRQKRQGHQFPSVSSPIVSPVFAGRRNASSRHRCVAASVNGYLRSRIPSRKRKKRRASYFFRKARFVHNIWGLAELLAQVGCRRRNHAIRRRRDQAVDFRCAHHRRAASRPITRAR